MNGEFSACTNRVVSKDGWVSISCKLGMWSVEGRDEDAVLQEALHYFRQYKADGEYGHIIGGPAVSYAIRKEQSQ